MLTATPSRPVRGPSPTLLGLALGMAAAILTGESAFAQSIQATVNRSEATLEDAILLSVTVEGAQRLEPLLPDLPDFDVIPRGSSSELQIVNGQATASVTYQYLLSPRSTGTFTIGPVTVSIGGRLYSSRPFQVKILSPESQPAESRPYFLRATVSTLEPYVGQQISYTWRFYRRVQTGSNRLDPLDFGGLLVEDLGEVREYTTTVRGLQYLVSEIRKALFAQQAGAVTIPASRLTCEVVMASSPRRRSPFDLFTRTRTQTKTLTTPPIILRVRPLPTPPANFSGLVGSFELRADLSKRELQVGESATLELSLSGAGNVQFMAAPALPDLSSFKVYPDKPTSAIERSANGLSGRKTFRMALVPQRAGELTVPAVKLAYFDPQAEAYRTASTADISLDVAPASDKEELMLTESVAPSTGKVAVRILADDILPIHRSFEAIEMQAAQGLGALLWRSGWVMPPAIFLGFLFFHRRQERFAADSGLRRRRGALRRASVEVRRLGKDGTSGPPLAQEASRCLRSYIGDKLDAEGSALTPAEAGELLSGRGVEEATAKEVRELLDRLEAAQFGATAKSSVSPAILTGKLEGLLKRLDRQIQGART